MLSKYKNRFLLLIVLLLAVTMAISNTAKVSASILFNRDVTISSAQASATVSDTFSFDIPDSSTLGSIVFEYCANSPSFYKSCDPPVGLDVRGASLASQSGNTGFSIGGGGANKIILSRAPSAGTITRNTYVFNSVVNPSAASPSVFVRISTYPTIDGTGPYTDAGGVGFAIQDNFNVDAFVPPFLQLCVGITVSPDCGSISGDYIDLGILSSTHANYGQSQFATATNDTNGYVIYAMGDTMTSGNNIIQSLGLPTPSFPGTPQFGMNLRANLLPAVGQDPVGLGTAAPTPNYDQPNRFTFVPGDSIVSATSNTNYNRMTVSYLVNITSKQPPGVYGTTITYVATVQF